MGAACFKEPESPEFGADELLDAQATFQQVEGELGLTWKTKFKLRWSWWTFQVMRIWIMIVIVGCEIDVVGFILAARYYWSAAHDPDSTDKESQLIMKVMLFYGPTGSFVALALYFLINTMKICDHKPQPGDVENHDHSNESPLFVKTNDEVATGTYKAAAFAKQEKASSKASIFSRTPKPTVSCYCSDNGWFLVQCPETGSKWLLQSPDGESHMSAANDNSGRPPVAGWKPCKPEPTISSVFVMDTTDLHEDDVAMATTFAPRVPPVQLLPYHYIVGLRMYLFAKDMEANDVNAVFKVNAVSTFTVGLGQMINLAVGFNKGLLSLNVATYVGIISQVVNVTITLLDYSTSIRSFLASSIEVFAKHEEMTRNMGNLVNVWHGAVVARSRAPRANEARNEQAKRVVDYIEGLVDSQIMALGSYRSESASDNLKKCAFLDKCRVLQALHLRTLLATGKLLRGAS